MLIRSLAHFLIAHTLKIALFNEWLWASRSNRSVQMSDCELIAQVAHDKRGTVSESIRSLMTKRLTVSNLLRSLVIKERMSVFFRSFALSLTKNQQFALKNLNKIVSFVNFFVSFFKQWAKCSFPRSGCSPKLRDCERFALVPHQKYANEQIARFFERITYSLIFSQKTSDSLKNWWVNSPPWIFSNFSKLFTQSLISIFYVLSSVVNKIHWCQFYPNILFLNHFLRVVVVENWRSLELL